MPRSSKKSNSKRPANPEDWSDEQTIEYYQKDKHSDWSHVYKAPPGWFFIGAIRKDGELPKTITAFSKNPEELFFNAKKKSSFGFYSTDSSGKYDRSSVYTLPQAQEICYQQGTQTRTAGPSGSAGGYSEEGGIGDLDESMARLNMLPGHYGVSPYGAGWTGVSASNTGYEPAIAGPSSQAPYSDNDNRPNSVAISANSGGEPDYTMRVSPEESDDEQPLVQPTVVGWSEVRRDINGDLYQVYTQPDGTETFHYTD